MKTHTTRPAARSGLLIGALFLVAATVPPRSTSVDEPATAHHTAGGFELTVALMEGGPSAVRLEIGTRGCKEPHRARVSARLHDSGKSAASETADLTALGPGRFAFDAAAGTSGLLEVTGRYRGMTSTVLVALAPDVSFEEPGRRSGRLANGYPYRILHRAARTADRSVGPRASQP